MTQGAFVVDEGMSYSAAAALCPGPVGLIASSTDITFDDLKVSRIDWPAPATPTWQVYNGTFGLASSPTRATLAPVEGDRLNLAVREGTYGDDYDIEAKLEGSGAGIAFRVQDKLNYYYVWQVSSGSLCYVILSKVIDGQDQQVTFSWTDQCDTSAVRHLHVKASGADLDVWVKEATAWPASPLISSGGDGQGVLSEIASGRVGMTTKDAEMATCSLLRVGSDDDSDHVLDPADEAVVDEAFAAIVTPSYDAAGNMISDGIYNYTYDAWNRLVQVTRLGPTSAPQVIAEYAYDGLGRRYRKIVSHSGDRGRTEYFYYDSQWRLLEVCVPDATQESNDRTTRQFVWGTQYIDELVCMDVDTDGDGDCLDEHEGTPKYGFERYRYFQDANWNVTAIWAEHAGHVVERYEYDPYGTCRIFAGWDSTAGCETGNVLGDSLVPGGNPIRYAGYHFDNETAKYQVRYRMYSPELGRWLQRDPAGYVDGSDLYSYARSSPIQNTDPRGLRIVAWRGDGVSPDNPNPSGRPDPSDPWQRTPLEQQDCGFCVYRADYTLTDCGHTWIGPCGDPTKWGLDSPAYWRSSAKCASKMWHTVRSPDNKKSCDAIYACLEKAMKTVGAGGGWVPGVNDCRTATNEAMAQCGLRRADLVELTPAPDCPKCPSAFSLLGINYWETSPLDW